MTPPVWMGFVLRIGRFDFRYFQARLRAHFSCLFGLSVVGSLLLLR